MSKSDEHKSLVINADETIEVRFKDNGIDVASNPFVWFFALFGLDLPGYIIEEKDKMITGIHKKRFTNFQAYIGLNWLKNDNDMQQKRINYAQILITYTKDENL